MQETRNDIPSTVRTDHIVPSIGTVDIAVETTYTRNEIPPRCRKERRVQHTMTVTAELPVVDAAETTLAFTVREAIGPDKNIYQVAGRLFTPQTHIASRDERHAPSAVGDLTEFPSTARITDTAIPSNSIADHAVSDARLSGLIVVDGMVWEPSAEPAYTVSSLGVTETVVSAITESFHRGRGAIFRADEFSETLAYAHERATGFDGSEEADRKFGPRADTEIFRYITVHDASAVRLVTALPAPSEIKELRINYQVAINELSRADSPDDEAAAFAKVCSLRKRIATAGHTPVAGNVEPYEDR